MVWTKGKTFQFHMSGDQIIEENKYEKDEQEERKWWHQVERENTKKSLNNGDSRRKSSTRENSYNESRNEKKQ